MKPYLTTISIALIAGFFSGYLGNVSHVFLASDNSEKEINTKQPHRNTKNPFQALEQPDDLEYQIEALQLKIDVLQHQVKDLQDFQDKTSTLSQNNKQNNPENSPNHSKTNSPVSPNKEILIESGINADIADDILRRLSQQDFRRLELQNLIQRSSSTTRRQYSMELSELNKNKISLRSEMGDEAYDKYLYVSGRNNRVKVRSVMAGSPAESSGFHADDVILSYDDQKILNWSDIRAATIKGEIGSYTNVEIMRDGEQMSLMVPRGTLGVQLDAVQLDPEQ